MKYCSLSVGDMGLLQEIVKFVNSPNEKNEQLVLVSGSIKDIRELCLQIEEWKKECIGG